jgi:hypothetical protein
MDLKQSLRKEAEKVNVENGIPTQEMLDWFEKRTEKHIGLVRKYIDKILKARPDDFSGLEKRKETHDQTKYQEPEKTPYVFITWQYRMKDKGEKFDVPKKILDMMNEATQHHVKHNRHHPELHDPKAGDGSINRNDRDAIPDKMVDGTKMSDTDLAEMVADWCAMSDEKGTQPKDWADKNVGKRWKFDDGQKKLIYDLIEEVWNK